MNISLFRGGYSLAIFTAGLVSALCTPAVFAAKPDKPSNGGQGSSSIVYSGQAVALGIDGVTHPVPGPIVVCDTGPLPPTGGHRQVQQANFSWGNGALTIDHASALAVGAGPEAFAESALTGYRVEFVDHDNHRVLIEADYVYGKATAWSNKQGKVSYDTQVIVENLRVNGQVIAVTGQPNQRVELPTAGGWLIINEQASAGSGNSGDIAVSPIHFLVCDCIEGHIGLVRAGLTVNGTPPVTEGDCGKVTGGGWIVGTPSGAKGTFGMSGGIRRGEFWGHLNFIDHGTGMKVSSTAVTGFQTDPANPKGRIINYTVTIDGAAGTARLLVIDNGEPGRSDVFDLMLSTGYRAVGELGGSRPGGGNIQLHKCPPGWE